MRVGYSTFVKGEQSPLTQERVDRLKEIEFYFGRSYDKRTFTQRLEEIVRYRERNGFRDPPRNTLLERWIMSSKRKYLDFKMNNMKTDAMNASRCKEMEYVGFDWTEGDTADAGSKVSKIDVSNSDASAISLITCC